MRRLKTLNGNRTARREVGLASKQSQSGDNMDFGLLCFERGVWEGLRLAVRAHDLSLLVGEPDAIVTIFKRELRKTP